MIRIELPKRVELMTDDENKIYMNALNRLSHALFIGDKKAEKEIVRKFKFKIEVSK